MGQLPEHLLAERILVFEDQVMHVPELVMVGGKLSRFGGSLCVWMYFSQREVSKDKPQLFSELLLKRFDDRVETPFMSSELKSPKSSVCVAGGASSNTFTLVFFSCTRRDSVNECRPALVAQ